MTINSELMKRTITSIAHLFLALMIPISIIILFGIIDYHMLYLFISGAIWGNIISQFYHFEKWIKEEQRKGTKPEPILLISKSQLVWMLTSRDVGHYSEEHQLFVRLKLEMDIEEVIKSLEYAKQLKELMDK